MTVILLRTERDRTEPEWNNWKKRKDLAESPRSRTKLFQKRRNVSSPSPWISLDQANHAFEAQFNVIYREVYKRRSSGLQNIVLHDIYLLTINFKTSG